MHRFYIVTAVVNGNGLPSFILSADTLGLVSAGHAANVALGIVAPLLPPYISYYLTADNGQVTVTHDGVHYSIFAMAAEDIDTAYPGPGSDPRARIARSDPAFPDSLDSYGVPQEPAWMDDAPALTDDDIDVVTAGGAS